jgi:hypothetical protein
LDDILNDEDMMAASREPPAKQTVTQVPQPTTSTLFALPINDFISSNDFCSATIISTLLNNKVA